MERWRKRSRHELMYRFLAESIAIPAGEEKVANRPVASLEPAIPLPARVVTEPDAST
jgi:hypothetical protein